jgi:uncharacterized C2H2 Zn-finger protein
MSAELVEVTIRDLLGSDTLLRCSQCNRGFKKASKLQRHIDELHDNIRKFECAVCHQFFKRK